MLCYALLLIEFSLVSSQLLSKDDTKHRYSDELNELTNEILLYMKRTQLTKPWGPSWTITPVYAPDMSIGRNRGSMLFPGHRTESDIDTEVEDYKQGLDPTYEKKTRASTTPRQSVTTTLSTSTPTEATTQSTPTRPTTTTTESPMAQELNEYIKNKNVGMFSAFTIKFFKIITEKKPGEVKPLFDVFAQYVDAILKDGRVNRLPDQNMALEVLQYLESLNIFLIYGKTEDIQIRAALFLKMIEDQHEDLLKSEYSVYHFVDKYFDSSDAPAMLKAIKDIGEYPGNGMTAAHVAGELMSILLLPLERLAGRQGHEDIKLRALSDSISTPKENVIDKNEAKLLKNYWNYKNDGIIGLFGNTKSNNGMNGATHSIDDVRPADDVTSVNKNRLSDTEKSQVNEEIFKPKRMDENNVTKNNNTKYSLNNKYDTNKGVSVDVVREVTKSKKVFKENNTKVNIELKGKYARRINKSKLSNDNKIEEENETYKGRIKMAYTRHGIEQDRRSYLKNENNSIYNKWHHRLRHNSNENSLKTKTDRNKRKLFKKSKDTRHKTIRSNELENQNNLFRTTRNTRRKNNENETKKQSLKKIKEKEHTSKKKIIGAIKGRLFDILKGKDARKLFTKTIKEGLSLVSSESDEEIELRKNIYKAIGVYDNFDKVKSM